jgi:hypothetical protein
VRLRDVLPLGSPKVTPPLGQRQRLLLVVDCLSAPRALGAAGFRFHGPPAVAVEPYVDIAACKAPPVAVPPMLCTSPRTGGYRTRVLIRVRVAGVASPVSDPHSSGDTRRPADDQVPEVG